MFLAGLCFSVASCNFFGGDPPYIISEFTIQKGQIADVCEIADAELYFRNTADAEISAVYLNFLLYYSDGTLPGFGSNRVAVEYSGKILSGYAEKLRISLDDYVHRSSELDLVADQFFVERIEYSDGSIWQGNFWNQGGLK
jgi:hypothetical protein